MYNKSKTVMMIFWVLILSVAAFAASNTEGKNGTEIDIPHQKFVLDNGLTLIVHEDHKAPIVAVNVWYHVGSKNEKAGKSGFAHLFEHLMFNGSENFNQDYFQTMERIGATDLNGTTNEDRTNYFQNVPTSALDIALWMESDRMGHLLGVVDQPKLDEQRGVVQNEKRQGENEPYGVTYELIVKNTYPAGHPYSWPVIGSMEDLNAASLDDVKDWFKTYYGAANAVIVVAGDIDAATAKAKVEKYFGDIPSGRPARCMDRPDDRDASPASAGSRSTSSALQSLEHASQRYCGGRLPKAGERRARLRQELSSLQTSGVRRSNLHQRCGLY